MERAETRLDGRDDVDAVEDPERAIAEHLGRDAAEATGAQIDRYATGGLLERDGIVAIAAVKLAVGAS